MQIRGDLTVDASGNSGSGTYSVTAVQSDSTLLDTGEGTVILTRMSVESIDAEGTSVTGVPTWNSCADGGGTPVATPSFRRPAIAPRSSIALKGLRMLRGDQ